MSKLLALFTGWKLWLLGAALFAAYSGALVLRAHHSGYESGVASMQGKLDTANKQIGQLTVQRDDALAAVGQVARQQRENKLAEDKAAAQAATALKQAQAQAKDADAALSAWMSRYAHALRDPACQKPTGALCAALSDY